MMKITSRMLALLLALALLCGLWAPALAANDDVLEKVTLTLNGPAVGKTLAQVTDSLSTNNTAVKKGSVYWYDGETGDYLGNETGTRVVEAGKTYTVKILFTVTNAEINATTKVTLNGMPMTKEGNQWVATLAAVNIQAPTTVELQFSDKTLTISDDRTTDWENPTYKFNWRNSHKVLELLDGFTAQHISVTGPLTIRLKGKCTLEYTPVQKTYAALSTTGDLNILADNASDSLTITQHGGEGGAIHVNSNKINLYGGMLNINMTADGNPYNTYPGVGSTSAILRTYGNAALNVAVETADTRSNYNLVAVPNLESHGSGPIHVQASRAGGGEVRAVSNLTACGTGPVNIEASRSAGSGDVVAVYNLYGENYPGKQTVTLSAQGSSIANGGNIAVCNVTNLGKATTLRAEKGILSLWDRSTRDPSCPDPSHCKVSFDGSHPDYYFDWKANKFWTFCEPGGTGFLYITDGITLTPYGENEYGYTKMTLNGYGGPLHNNPTTRAEITFDRPVAGLTVEDFTVTGASADRLEAGTEEGQYILYLKDYIFADAVAQALQADENGEFTVLRAASTEELLQYGRQCEPYAVLMEVNGYPPYVLAERLKLRDAIKEKSPGCKIVLVVDENSEKEVAEEVREAKKAGRIDQFIYGSISANYLVALMDTL